MNLPLTAQPAPDPVLRSKLPTTPQGWVDEAAAAREAGDFPRAIVCYRRAVELAPFCTDTRNAFESTIEEQILTEEALRSEARKRTRIGAPAASAKVVPATAPTVSQGPRVIRQADFDEPEPVAPAPRSSARYVPRKKKNNTTLWIAAAAFAVVVTTASLVAASFASSRLGDALASQAAPAALPAALTEKLESAEKLVSRGEPAKAVESLRASLLVYSDHEDVINAQLAAAHAALGEKDLKTKKYDSAITAFESAVKADGDNAGYQVRLASALREKGRSASIAKSPTKQKDILRRAESAAREATRIEPDSAEALLVLAQVLETRKERTKASDTYQQLLDRAPSSDEAQIARTALKQLKK